MKEKYQHNDGFIIVQRIISYLMLTVVLAYAACLLSPDRDGETLQPLSREVAVSHEEGSLFGNVLLAAENGLSLAEASVLINGEVVGNMRAGSLLVRVYPGDVIAIDGSAYKRRLGFTVSAVSANIDGSFLSGAVWTDGTVADVGIAVFK